MDTVRKPTHLTQEAMLEVLRAIGGAGIRDAMTAWTEERRPKNIGKFRQARGWVVLDDQGRKYPHRPLISLAYELRCQQNLDPNNFGLPNDEVCKAWLSGEQITWEAV